MTQAGPAHPLVMAWTPQQDLEEESSSDGGLEVPSATRPGVVQPKFSPRSHVFSLSLPRDDRLCLSLYADNVDFIAPKVSRTMPTVSVVSLGDPFISSVALNSAMSKSFPVHPHTLCVGVMKKKTKLYLLVFLSVYINGCHLFWADLVLQYIIEHQVLKNAGKSVA
jgi:hypothetical protein